MIRPYSNPAVQVAVVSPSARKCDYCKESVTPAMFSSHLKLCTAASKFTSDKISCDICKKEFRSTRIVLQHIISAHRQNIEKSESSEIEKEIVAPPPKKLKVMLPNYDSALAEFEAQNSQPKKLKVLLPQSQPKTLKVLHPQETNKGNTSGVVRYDFTQNINDNNFWSQAKAKTY